MTNKSIPKKTQMPASRDGWMRWYINRYNNKARSANPVERELEICAAQALWFYLNILAFGDRSYSPSKERVEEQEEELETA